MRERLFPPLCFAATNTARQQANPATLRAATPRQMGAVSKMNAGKFTMRAGNENKRKSTDPANRNRVDDVARFAPRMISGPDRDGQKGRSAHGLQPDREGRGHDGWSQTDQQRSGKPSPGGWPGLVEN